jgi:thiol:disulfide interchange protein DsbC
MKYKHATLGVSGLATLGFSLIAAAAAPAKGVTTTIRETLAARYPSVPVVDVRPGPMPGLYEVFTGDQIAYSDATGDHLFVGTLVETKSQRDLSAEKLDERLAIDFAALPFDRAIKTVKGDGSRKLAVFSDPDCPYCQQLEHELASITNVTIYTFLYPIAQLHPGAPAKAHAIWCSENKSQVWTDWMVEKKAPTGASCDNDPIEELQALGKKLRVNSTPTLYSGTGKRFGGALSAAKLEKMLNEGAAGTAAVAANTGGAAGGSH